MTDRDNAHIRRGNPKAETEQQISEAERFINDPVFERGFGGMRDSLVGELESMQHDGSEACDDYVLEVARTLRTMKALKRNIVISIQGKKLQLAGIPVKSDGED